LIARAIPLRTARRRRELGRRREAGPPFQLYPEPKQFGEACQFITDGTRQEKSATAPAAAAWFLSTGFTESLESGARAGR
jgi:hypothetical protein